MLAGKDSSEAGGAAGRAIVIGGDVDEQYLLQPGRGEETVSMGKGEPAMKC